MPQQNTDSCESFFSPETSLISQTIRILKRLVCGYVIHTHLFILSTKFPDLLLSYANYFYTSEEHTNLSKVHFSMHIFCRVLASKPD